ncbi:unnamed protein product [Victoria cruziana]
MKKLDCLPEQQNDAMKFTSRMTCKALHVSLQVRLEESIECFMFKPGSSTQVSCGQASPVPGCSMNRQFCLSLTQDQFCRKPHDPEERNKLERPCHLMMKYVEHSKPGRGSSCFALVIHLSYENLARRRSTIRSQCGE